MSSSVVDWSSLSAALRRFLPMSSSVVDWSSLPAALLQTIAGYLKTIPDYIHFRSVCRHWRAAAELRLASVPQQFPRLMLPLNQSSKRRCFFNPLTNTHYGRPLPEAPASYRCIGSSLGRVILIDGSPDMIVLNPITGEKTHLPPLSSFPEVVQYDPLEKVYTINHDFLGFIRRDPKYMRDYFLGKVILTRDSQDPNRFSAFAISHSGFHYLAYCKHGDRSWSRVDGLWGQYDDAISYRGKLHLVNRRGALAACDFDECGTPIMNQIRGNYGRVGSYMNYLVDVMGKLVLVERCLKWTWSKGYYTAMFEVLEFGRSGKEWRPVTSLGDSVLFVGQNSTFAVRASDYPGCRGNRIYFTDDYYYGVCCQRNGMIYRHVYGGCCRDINKEYEIEYDVGAYDLATGTIEKIPLYDRKKSFPVWFTPSLW